MKMGAPLPAYRLIRHIHVAEREALPVSLALSPDGSQIVVSRFGDDIWDFYPYILQESLSLSGKRIDWRARMPDGGLLTDKQHGALLESAKAFIWSLYATPIDGRKRPSMLTLVVRAKVLLFLLRWMYLQGRERFVELDGITSDYAAAARYSGERNSSPVTVHARLQIVQDIYHQRANLDDALRSEPWPGERASVLAGLYADAKRFLPKTEPIPERVAAELGRIAVDYVRRRSNDILAARDAKEAAMREKRDAGFGHDTIKAARSEVARSCGYENAYKLNRDVHLLRTACLIVIGLFSGMRSSELLSIAENSISHRPSRDGSCETTWIHGTIYKMGIKPKAWQVPALVEDAIRVIERLTQSLRMSLQQEALELRSRVARAANDERPSLVKRLNIAERHQSKLFLAKDSKANNSISVLSNLTAYADLRWFCRHHSILGDNGQPYPLHPHQFRRTYARFVARAELGDLLTLREHFGHWSLDMTLYYADGATDDYQTDREMLEMIAEEKLARQTEIVRDYLDTDAPLANGGQWLGEWRSRVRVAESKEALIAQYAGSITLNGTGHSWCVGNAKGTGCGGLCVFEAQMCVTCRYGIIGPEHRPVWQGIRDQQLEVLQLGDVGESGRTRAKHILQAAETVLNRLDGEGSQ